MKKDTITELIYKNSVDTGDGILIRYENIEPLINKIEQAINNTGCSLELKEIKKDNFERWVLANRYELYINGYKKGLQHFSEAEIVNKYTDYLQSF